MFLNVLGFNLEDKLEKKLEEAFDGEVISVDELESVVEKASKNRYDSIILDASEISEDDLTSTIERIQDKLKRVTIIVISNKSSLKIVARSIKKGAYDYLVKPVEEEYIVNLIKKVIKDKKLKAEKVDIGGSLGSRLIGQTKEIIEVYKQIGKMAGSKLPVLIKGEKGTGKTSVASAIHTFSDYCEEPFVSINCIAFQNEILERKLFGYESKAFPGAHEGREGAFEKAGGGTLHLGNIEALSLDIQSKLLGFLEGKEVIRIGGYESIKPNVRIIATTNENLSELIAKNEFIEELYHKLQVLELEIPPLRDRKEDIPLIIDYNIRKYNLEFSKNIRGLSKPALKKIMRYEWPGNVRELKNAIRSATSLCRGSSILIEDLPGTVVGSKPIRKKNESQDWILENWISKELSNFGENGIKDYHGNIIAKVEKELIRQVLKATNGKKVDSAEILGITRNTLRTKMSNYNLE